jgi:hypothetical protein
MEDEMNQVVANPLISTAEQHLGRQMALFTDVVTTDLMNAQNLAGSRKDKYGVDRRREIEHAMKVAKVCAEVATALAKLRGASLDINVRRIADAEHTALIEG